MSNSPKKLATATKSSHGSTSVSGINRYKSIKTYQRLKEVSTKEPVMELGDTESINKALSQFRYAFRQKVFPDSITSAIGQPSNNLELNSSMNSATHQRRSSITPVSSYAGGNQSDGQTTAGGGRASKQSAQVPAIGVEFGDNLQGFLDNKFKQQLQKNMNKENAVVKMFGNALIATVFQSLVIKTVESLYKISINLETDFPISSNVLKAFDISTIALSSFKTSEEKSNYIMSCMDKTISQMVVSFKEKQDFKEKKLEEQEKHEAKKKSWRTGDDHFPWLKVKTEYESLRKRLSTSIVEKLNDYENLVLVLESIKAKQELKKQGRDSEAAKVKYVLMNTQVTTTKDVFQNMSQFGNPRIQQFLSRLGVSDQTDQLQTSSFFKGDNNANDMRKTGVTQENGNNETNEETAKKIQNFWSKEKEDQFKSGRQEKKKLYYNEITSSSWNEVGFLPFVQQYFLEMKKSMQRDHLLDRYADGEWLTAEELKLLANTSELLNSCIDRKFMQNAVDIIDKDVIQNLELGLAEEILKDYEQIQIGIKRSRQMFIKDSLSKAQEKLRFFEAKKQKEREAQSNEEYHLKKKKMITSICYKMEKEGQFLEKAPANLPGAEPLQKFLNGKTNQDELVRELKSINFYTDEPEIVDVQEIERKRAEQRLKEQRKKNQENMSLPKQSLNTKFFESVTRHNYHPPSKLFVTDERAALLSSTPNVDSTPEEIVKYSQIGNAMQIANQKDEERYKLNLKAHIAYKNPHNFKRYYTGGPNKPLREKPFYNPLENEEAKANAYELRSIIMIQKKFREHREVKRMKELLDTKEKDRHYQYKLKIDSIRHLFKQNFKIQPGPTNSISDLEVFPTDDLPTSQSAMKKNKEQKESIQQQSQQQHSNSNSISSNKLKLNLAKQSSLLVQQNNNNNNTSNLNTTAMTINNSSGLLSKRPTTGRSNYLIKDNDFLCESNRKLTENTSNNMVQSIDLSNNQRPTTAFSRNSKNNQTNLNSSYVLGALHYPTIFNSTEDIKSEFKKSKEQLATKPIEKQLRNIQLIKAASSNRFWTLATGNFIYSKRDLYLARDSSGMTALHWAVYHKNDEFIQYLLNQGADPNTPDVQGDTPTHRAFATDKLDIIRVIVNSGGDLNSVNTKGQTPLALCSANTLQLLHLTSGTKSISLLNTPENNNNNNNNVVDNNLLLRFITQDEISSFQAVSYTNRFQSNKIKRDPTARLQLHQASKKKIGQERNQQQYPMRFTEQSSL